MAETQRDPLPASEVIYDPTGAITPGSQGQEARGELRPGYVRTESFKSPLTPMTPAQAAAQALRQQEEVNTRREVERGQYLQETQPDYDRYRDFQRTNPMPSVPHLAKDVGPPPDQQQYQKHAMAYLGAMSVLLAFYGKLAGTSGADGLRAFSAAAEGWHTGNQQAYENGFKEWEAANKRMQQYNENMLKEYDLVIKDRSLRREEIVDRLKMAAIKYRDNQSYNDLMQGNLEKVFQRRDILFKANNDLSAALAEPRKESALHNADLIKRSNAYADMEENNWIDPRTNQPYIDSNTGQPYTETQKAKARLLMQSVPPGSTVNTEGRIEFPGVGSGRMSEFQQWQLQHPGGTMEEFWKAKALSRPPRNAPAIYIQKYIEKHPEADDKDIRNAMAIYNATQSRMRALGTREVNVGVAVNEAIRTAKLAQEASDKVPRGPWVKLNEIQQKIREGTSSPEQRTFNLANSALITAYAQTMSRSGVNTVHAQQRAENVLLTADGPEAYRAGIKQLLREADTVKEAVRDTYREMMEEGGGAETSAPVGGGSASSVTPDNPLGLSKP